MIRNKKINKVERLNIVKVTVYCIITYLLKLK